MVMHLDVDVAHVHRLAKPDKLAVMKLKFSIDVKPFSFMVTIPFDPSHIMAVFGSKG